MSSCIKIIVKKPRTHSTISVVCNNKKYQIPIPYQQYNFFELFRQATVDNKFQKYLEVLCSHNLTCENVCGFYDIQQFCKKYFGVKIAIDFNYLGQQIMADVNAQSITQELDHLEIVDIRELIKIAYDTFPDKMHNKVSRRIKSYLKISKRQQIQKNQISNLINLVKKQTSDEEEPLSKDHKKRVKSSKKEQKRQEKIKESIQHTEIRQKKEKKRVQKKYRHRHPEYERKLVQNDGSDEQKSQEKHKKGSVSKTRYKSKKQKQKECRIMLGIKGDTDEGWRERNRILRTSNSTNLNTNKKNKTERVVEKNQVKIESNPSKQLKLVYSFPEDGEDFQFKKEKEYKIHINDLFWVNFSKEHMTVQKDNKGYVRKGGFELVGGDMLAEGMTISLEDGNFKLEDGGTPFGDPKFEEFVPKGVKNTKLKKIEVYSYV